MALSDHRADMESCCRCSACKFIPLEKVTGYARANVCPSVSRFGFHSYSAGGRMGFGLGLIHGRVEYTAKTAEVIYHCHLCGACDVSCKYAMEFDVLEALYAMREECVEHGRTVAVWDKLVEGLRDGAPLTIGAETGRGVWCADLPVLEPTQEDSGSGDVARDRVVPPLSTTPASAAATAAGRDQPPVLFHAGCLAGHEQASGRAAALAVKLLLRGAVEVAVDKQGESCCGGRAYEMGYRQAALDQAKRNAARFKALNVRQLVTGCAHCYQYFKVLYPKLGVDHGLQVFHISEYLASLVAEGRLVLSRPVDLLVTYHDPCHLGRLSEPWVPWQGFQRMRHMRVYDPPRVLRRGTHGVYEPPRRLLQSIPQVRLVEMDRVKEYAWCCGAGGGVRESDPAFAAWTARERMAEAEATGAEAVVTACPHCQRNLSESSGRPVYDLVELLAEAVGESV